MKILISGTHGLIGSALVEFFRSKNYRVMALARPGKTTSLETIPWDFVSPLQPKQLESLDAVIHLAGENIVSSRWTSAKKKKIYDSRVVGTKALAQAITQCQVPPKVLICASAVGIYGHRGDEALSETSAPGQGFLAKVCQDWETATQSVHQETVRVVYLRFGAVLSPTGGMLGKMLPVFKKGLGGYLGNGKQILSWIAMEDLVRVVEFVFHHQNLKGPINVVSPQSVTNKEFTQALGAVLKRPTFLHMPKWVVTLLMGEMGQEVMLVSTKAIPEKLQQSGFHFKYPNLEKTLKHYLC